jgi:apolipoprotein N-acyltransferase
MPVSAPFSKTRSGGSPQLQGRRLALRCLGAALLSSLILNLAYFPTAQGWLAWFALVPGLVLVRTELRPRTRYLIAWFAAWAFFLPALRWMRVAHETMVFSWIGLSLFCSWFAPVALLLVRQLDRRSWPLTLSVPVVWTALEFVRSHIFGGFPWYLLGYSQHDFLPLIQVADLAGVLGVTFLVAAVNGLLAEWLFSRRSVQSSFTLDVRSANLRPQFIAVAGVLVAALVYGGWRLSQNQFAEGPIVAILQTDLEQDIRNTRPDDAGGSSRSVQDIRLQTLELTKQARQLPRKADLIIWPETTFEFDYKEPRSPPPNDEDYRKWAEDIPDRQNYVREVAAVSQTMVLLGLNAQEYVAPKKIHRYNSALLIDQSGKTLARYDKTHLVPFGEYVPLYEILPSLGVLAPYANDELTMLTPGERFPRIAFAGPAKTYTLGCLICYESAYSQIAREYIRSPEPVDFLVNQSNDGWFRCTQEHEEHLAVSRFRAIECRRALVRAVNMGISAVIDGNGRIVALPGPTWAESKGVMRIVSAAVPLDQRTSVYARTGDWLPWLCWLGITVSVVRGRKGRAA